MKLQILSILLIATLFACTTQTKPRGFIFPENAQQLLAASKTQADIKRNFGDPGATTLAGGNWWIYYGMDENYRGPFPLKYDNRRAMLVKFDANKRVVESRLLTDADLPAAPKISDKSTPIPAEIDLNMFEELIMNVGRFKPAS